jgi:hypothetical protein
VGSLVLLQQRWHVETLDQKTPARLLPITARQRIGRIPVARISLDQTKQS